MRNIFLSTHDLTTLHAKLDSRKWTECGWKTTIGKQLITMFRTMDNTFPNTFISIDGANFRTSSVVYQTIIKSLTDVEACQSKNIKGFSNLQTSHVFSKIAYGNIFGSSSSKQAFVKWLRQDSNKGRVSLYVPDTFGQIYVTVRALLDKVKRYVDITDDHQWIGCFIWQHLEGGERQDALSSKTTKVGSWSKYCDQQNDAYRCVGTKNAGSKRAYVEGKEYSSDAWLLSMNNGRNIVKHAPGSRIEVHNCGKRVETSLLTEYSINGKFSLDQDKMQQFQNMDYQWV